jgi:hypothetical protein
MNMKRKIILTIFLLGWCLNTSIAQKAPPQSAHQDLTSTSARLEKRVKTYEEQSLSTTDAFYLFLNNTGVPGGLVRTMECKDDAKKHNIAILNDPMRQLLDALVTQDPNYKCEYANGTVNLLLVSYEPALLNIEIKEFHVENITSAQSAVSILLSTPEVKQAMEALNLKPGLTLIVEPVSLRPKSFNVECKNMTLREVLNAIAKAQGNGIWEYIEAHCEGRQEVVIRF